MEIIIFSVLLVVGVSVFITMNVPGYFPAVNAHAGATKHQRSQKNIQRLEHELGMCVSGCPQCLKPPPGGMRARVTADERRRLYEMGLISSPVPIYPVPPRASAKPEKVYR